MSPHGCRLSGAQRHPLPNVPSRVGAAAQWQAGRGAERAGVRDCSFPQPVKQVPTADGCSTRCCCTCPRLREQGSVLSPDSGEIFTGYRPSRVPKTAPFRQKG